MLSDVKVVLIYRSIINYSMQQNQVPVIIKLTVENITESEINDIQISIESDPNFSAKWVINNVSIKAGEIFQVTNISLSISTKFLAELTEKISGRLLISVLTKDITYYQEYFEVDVLAYDQWAGSTIVPELLTSFITPNHPAISRIIVRASEILSKWTSNPSFNEYQSQSTDRVRKQIAAIYESIENTRSYIQVFLQVLRRQDNVSECQIKYFLQNLETAWTCLCSLRPAWKLSP